MGNDGGSIPTRRELVKSAARTPTTSELKATALESLAHAWSVCPLSSEPLDKSNVVSDWRGRLYNYESILQGLMPSGDDAVAKATDQDAPDQPFATPENGKEITFASTGITSLKDVVKLQLTKAEGANNGSRNDKGGSVYVCPLSQKELGPGTKCVYIVPCGHVFYEVALKQVAPEDEPKHACPQCSEEFWSGNTIPILPTEEKDIKRLSERIERLRAEGLTHRLKKEKKEKNEKKEKKRKHGTGGGEDASRKDRNGEKKKKGDKLSGINNSGTATLTAKVVAELEAKNKRRKLAGQ
ncbi:uncharacterized protein MKZ38_005087 [Zalerion maritima]|uniref:Replication termination factor 2 n=1 Tax=Zalerion maritima TaxID=339359 RepID=A0AAD5RKR9_9PEZI|nr:uncharacterized protein MKZ38_005087 [Zalerion maritima]